MKQILLSLAAACLFAVGAQAQVSYGVKAGVNLPKQVVKMSGNGLSASVETSALTSFYVSGYANIPAASNFAIQPGIAFQGKGGKLDLNAMGSGEVSQSIWSVDIPVNAVYSIPTGNSGSVFVGAGPYVGVHLSGKVEMGEESQDLSIGSGADDQLKRIDYGVNFQLGYAFDNGFLINGGYGLGLANIINMEADGSNPSVKGYNRILSIGIGYEF